MHSLKATPLRGASHLQSLGWKGKKGLSSVMWLKMTVVVMVKEDLGIYVISCGSWLLFFFGEGIAPVEGLMGILKNNHPLH